jgi:hypothetical protein
MPSMIENLTGGAVRRPDEKRLLPTRRPLPGRTRDLLELLVSLGATASLKSVMLSADFREAEPRNLTYVALNRWPTAAEQAAQPEPYEFGPHFRALIFGQEFRESLLRRICDAYPDRQRVLYVRIPRCAGEHLLTTIAPMHPLFTPDLSTWRRGNGPEFIVALATYLGRFNSTKTIMVAQPSQHPFLETPPLLPTPDAAFPWRLNPPPYRAGDRLFTIIREPRSLILSLINAELDREGQIADRKQHGLALLRALTLRNLLCTALGDGTAAGALALCRLTDIEIADLSLYPTWVRYSWDTEAEPPTNCSTPHLTLEDLDADGIRNLDAIIAEDLVFYRHFTAALEKRGSYQSYVRGRHL